MTSGHESGGMRCGCSSGSIAPPVAAQRQRRSGLGLPIADSLVAAFQERRP